VSGDQAADVTRVGASLQRSRTRIKLNRRSYDGDQLNPLRLQPSGVREKKNLWEIRHDPYDVSRIFVRGRDGWITVFWKHLDRVPMPFGELAWNHVRRQIVAEGRGATEEQIADAVAALLRRAHDGPAEQEKPRKMTSRDRRVAARTTATAPPAAPPGPQHPKPARAADAEQAPAATTAADSTPEEANTLLAKVIPLGIFDPFAEAEKRW